MRSVRAEVLVLLLVVLCSLLLQCTYCAEVLKVKDAYGRVLELRVPVRSVVTLAPGLAEAIWFLGAEDKLVGVTRFCNWPPELVKLVREGKVKVVGGIVDPNIEVVVALRPDLVLATTMTPRDVVTKLEEAGLRVLVLPHPRNLTDVLNQVKLLAKIVGAGKRGEELLKVLEDLYQYLKELSTRVRKVKVYLEMWYGPIWTIGAENYMNEVIELAGGENIFSDTKTVYVQASDEEVIRRDPEVIILCRGMGYRYTPADVLKRPGWDSITAVKNLRIYVLEGPALDALYRYPSPRVLFAALHLLTYLHPELVPDLYTRLVRELATLLLNSTMAQERVAELTAELGKVRSRYEEEVTALRVTLKSLRTKLAELRSTLERVQHEEEVLRREVQLWQVAAVVLLVVLVLVVVVSYVRRRRT